MVSGKHTLCVVVGALSVLTAPPGRGVVAFSSGAWPASPRARAKAGRLNWRESQNPSASAASPGGPLRAFGSSPKKPMGDRTLTQASTPEEREREWAARIIEQHQRRKKEVEVQSVVTRVAKKIVPSRYTTPARPGDDDRYASPARPFGDDALAREPKNDPATTRFAQPAPVVDSARLALVRAIFDGSLGRVRLSLRASGDAMLSATGDFAAAATTDDDGVLILRTRRDGPHKSDSDAAVECLVDTRRCAAADFAARRDAFAVSLRRDDDTTFLSILLLGRADGEPVSDAAVARFYELRDMFAAPPGRRDDGD